MELSQLLTILKFPTPVDAVLKQEFLNDTRRIRDLARDAYCGSNLDFPIRKLQPADRLTVITYLLIHQYHRYAEMSIPEEIIHETFRDVSLRAELYYRQNHGIGLNEDDAVWFRHIMNRNIFKIGVLQFQPFDMIYLDEETIGEPYMVFTKEQKRNLPSGSPVINCHIQQNADLHPDNVANSFTHAKAFFKTYFPGVGFQAFLCYSWLLYPSMLGILPKDSRIRQFAESFEIISSCPDSAQAMEYLFSMKNKTKTSLQKYAESQPECFGFSCGIIRI